MVHRQILIVPMILALLMATPILAQETEEPEPIDPLWLTVTFTGNVLQAYGLNYTLPFNVGDPIEGKLVVQGVLVACQALEDNQTYVLTFSEHPKVTLKNTSSGAEFTLTDYPKWLDAAVLPGTLTLNYVKDLGLGRQYTLNWSYQYLKMTVPGNEFAAGVATFTPDVLPDGSNTQDSVGDTWGRITDDIITSPQRTLQVSVNPEWVCLEGWLCDIPPDMNPCLLVEED